MVPFTARLGAATAFFAAGAVAWGLAEHFTRVRRLALTSIVLMLAFVVGAAGFAAFGLTGGELVRDGVYLMHPGRIPGPDAHLRWGVFSLAAAAAASMLHWRRFRVAAAVGTAAALTAASAVGGLLLSAPAASALVKPLTFVAGLAVFALAMRWDLSDPARRTLRSDVAFWLHLAAAPMIVGPAFAAIGAHKGAVSAGTAAAAIGLYLALSAVALAVDRRALMASALFYLLAAVGGLVASTGTFIVSALALTGLVVGPALLLLSAFWGSARRVVLAALPKWLASRLPPPPSAPAAVATRGR